MKFKTVAEAFNFYKDYTAEQLEKRAAEIKDLIERDANVDINALNIELTGIKEAKENLASKAGSVAETRGAAMNLITGQSQAARPTFDAESVTDTKEYRSAFLKTMLGQQLTDVEADAFNVAMKIAEKRADEYNTSTNAAAVLPTTMLNEVVKKARTIGGLISECRAFNMPTKIAIPVGTPGTKAAWHVEGEAVDTEKATVANVIFDGYEIIKIFSISAKVRKMSIAAFESYLTDELVACVMECLADSLVNGTGSGEGTGLESITWTTSGATQNAVEVASGDDILYTDVIEAAGLLKRGYAQGAKWAMNNKTLYNVFFTMADSNAQPIFVAKTLGEAKAGDVGRILGFDVVIDDNIADNVIYLGNYSKYLGYNMPDGIMIDMSKDSSFKKGLYDYRALAIADCKPIVEEAFVKLYIAE